MPPPADYYVDNLLRMIDWVRTHHAHLVDAPLAGFMATVERLPDAPRRLFVRLLMRRGPHFRVDLLDYAEVPDPARASLALALAGLVRLETGIEPRLGLLRNPELRQLLAGAGARSAGMRRADLLVACSVLPAAQIAGALPPVVARRGAQAVAMLRLLFFGNLRQDLTEFILADLGTLRFAQPRLVPRLPWRDAASVRRSLDLQRAADAVHSVTALLDAAAVADGDAPEPAARREALDMLAAGLAPLPEDADTLGRRARALVRLADLVAADGRRARQIRLLRLAAAPPARERLCRLLAGAGRLRTAARVLDRIRAAPADAVEAHFAARFDPALGRCRPTRRRGGAIRFARLRLPAPAPGVDAAVRIEQRVAAVLAGRGNRVLHMENRLPGMLFLLGCWDILYAPLPGAFVQPFQAGPGDLYSPAFAERRAAAIECRTAAIGAGRYDREAFLAVLAEHCGTVNPFWSWHHREVAAVPAILDSLPAPLRAGLCGRIAAAPARARTGFPDLTIVNGREGCYEFVEIKGPGDQLRPAQRDWLQWLADAGARASVLEVRWA